MSNSISQRAHSVALTEKLKEIPRQERIATPTEPHSIQKAVSIRLWRLMQRRLRDPSAGKKLKSIRTADTVLPSSELDEDADSILSLEKDDVHHEYLQSDDFLELDDEDEEDLLHIEYESEWEDLFTDAELDDSPLGDDMLDYLHDGQCDGSNQITDAFLEDEMSSVFEDMLEI